MKNRSRPEREVLGYIVEQINKQNKWEAIIELTTLFNANAIRQKNKGRIRKVVREIPRKPWPKLEENANE